MTATALILPTWSGTWSTKWGRFDAWQPTRYGGRSDLYQGDKYNSGLLVGIAVYGDQIAALGATARLQLALSLLLTVGLWLS